MKSGFFYCLGVVLLCSSCNCKNEELYNLYVKDLKYKIDNIHFASVYDLSLLNGKLKFNNKQDNYVFADNCRLIKKINIFYTEGEKTDNLIKSSSSKDEAMQHINTFIAIVHNQLGRDVGADLLLKRLKKNEIDSNIEYKILFLRYVYDVFNSVAENIANPYPLSGPSRPCN